jgi:hypothetical protein
MLRGTITRFGSIAALLLLTIGLLTGCGNADDEGGIPTANAPTQGAESPHSSEGTNPTTAAEPGGLAFADCMRDHDVAMSDPDPQTGVPQIAESEDMDSSKVQAAVEACQHLAPAGVRGAGEQEEQDLDLYLEFSQCMRENGLPEFPDPQPSSEGMFSHADIDRESPAYQAATKACSDILSGESE